MPRAASPKKGNEAPQRPNSTGKDYQELVASLYADPAPSTATESQQQNQ